MKYSIKDSGGGRSIEVDYAAIQTEEQQRVEEQNAWFRNAGLFWIVLGIIHVIVRYQMEGTLKGSIWLLIGGLCVLLFSYAKTIYTVIPWEHGQIYIIKNRDHDQILDMIRAFRKKRLLSLCGDINYTNDPNDETAKFKWLLNQNAISQDTFAETTQKIQSYHALNLDKQYEDDDAEPEEFN